MEVSVKTLAVTHIAVALCAGLLLHQYGPKQTVTVEKEVVKDRIVEHIVERKAPDGTTETVTDRTTTSKTESNKTQTQSVPAQYLVQIGVERNLLAPTADIYKLQVLRRIAGPVWLGASVDSSQRMGVSLGFEF